MPDGPKQIMSRLTGRKKQKTWNKTREKYMPVKRRQNLAETERASHFKEEWLDKSLDSKRVFYNGNEGDNDENNEQQQLLEGFANSCYKIVSPILCKILLTICRLQAL